jgi:ribosomal-protein-alanine N-acetyltransferase
MRTERLLLVPATAALTRADLAGRDALAAELGVEVPDNWPPEFYDPAAVQYTLEMLESDPDVSEWSTYYIVRTDLPDRPRLAGIVGYKGRPTSEGEVEIGYSVLEQHQRVGIATEAARALVDRAFRAAGVELVRAETLPDLAPSIRVIEKLGFAFVGEGSEPGVIRYERRRPAATA